MLSTQRLFVLLGLVAVIGVATLSGTPAFCRDTASEEDTAKEADPFVVPDGGPAELVEYLKGLKSDTPSPRDRQAYFTYVIKSLKPKWEAADKVLSDETATKKQKKIAASAKFEAISIAMQLRNKQLNAKAKKAMRQMPKVLSELGLKRQAKSADLKRLSIELKMITDKEAGAPSLKDVSTEVAQFVRKDKTTSTYRLAFSTITALAEAKDTEQAVALCDLVTGKVKKLVSKDSNPRVLPLAFSVIRALQETGKTEQAAEWCELVAGKVTDLVSDSSNPNVLQTAYGAVYALNDAKDEERVTGLCDLIVKKVKDAVSESPDGGSFRLAYGAVSMFQRIGRLEQGGELCDQLVKIYESSDEPGAEAVTKRLTGIGRRLRLIGHPMKVEGTVFDGDEFDWSAYKGKVVLVQFWATWCGWCIKEIPHIQECYDAYHDRGFDVVAISLDRKAAPLEKYLDKKPVPWAVLYKAGERNPTADYYGVIGLPTLILVDKEGNVVSIEARGEKLNEELEKLLGPMKEKGTAETGA